MPRPRRLTNRVRIIGGKWKGRKLAVASAAIRPTPDRARVTVFNWLAAELRGARILDLFAGTGVLGFEALSRGAAHADLIDNDPDACRSLQHYRRELGAAADVHRGDALRWLRESPEDERWDVVFLDPPFGSTLLAEALPLAAAKLARHGAMYVETDTRFDTAEIERLTGLSMVRHSHAGASHYALLRHARSVAHPVRDGTSPSATG